MVQSLVRLVRRIRTFHSNQLACTQSKQIGQRDDVVNQLVRIKSLFNAMGGNESQEHLFSSPCALDEGVPLLLKSLCALLVDRKGTFGELDLTQRNGIVIAIEEEIDLGAPFSGLAARDGPPTRGGRETRDSQLLPDLGEVLVADVLERIAEPAVIAGRTETRAPVYGLGIGLELLLYRLDPFQMEIAVLVAQPIDRAAALLPCP
jgi:hypothetical protein